MSAWSLAANSTDDDCPAGHHPAYEQARLRNLANLGYKPGEIEAMLKEDEEGGGNLDEIMMYRGRLNGEPVNAFAFPASVADPKLPAVDGKVGRGFNLDGADGPNDFRDPDTGARGIDNQLARALGCGAVFRGTWENPPTYWVYIWGQLKDSQPAWLMTITGDDLAKDGPVTVTFDRALEHLVSNTDGSARADVTYRVDKDPRSHNEYKAILKEGVITLEKPGAENIRLLQNPLMLVQFRMSKMQLRISLRRDGTVDGMIGGYQPWGDLYFSFAAGGAAGERCVYNDVPGLYHLLKNHADAEPHPETGQNSAISAAYQFEAVPAFVAPPAKQAGSAKTGPAS